jgi:hypothetical protein
LKRRLAFLWLWILINDIEDQDYIEPTPPSADRVARRAIVLSVLSCRGILEGDQENREWAADLAKRSYDWLRAIGLEEDLSAWERQIFATPFGNLLDRDKIDASWLSETVVVFGWALGKTELPGCETQCDASAVANKLGFLQPTDRTALYDPQLRPGEYLQEYNEFIYNLHWRVRDFSLTGRSYDFESLARKAWGEPILRHGLALIDRDLSVGGSPILRAEERAWRTLASITRERHRASNWLIGYGSENFYEVTTDT